MHPVASYTGRRAALMPPLRLCVPPLPLPLVRSCGAFNGAAMRRTALLVMRFRCGAENVTRARVSRWSSRVTMCRSYSCSCVLTMPSSGRSATYPSPQNQKGCCQTGTRPSRHHHSRRRSGRGDNDCSANGDHSNVQGTGRASPHRARVSPAHCSRCACGGALLPTKRDVLALLVHEHPRVCSFEMAIRAITEQHEWRRGALEGGGRIAV
jgi:hypothetical protein